MPNTFIQFPASIQTILQNGVIERVYKETLMKNLLFLNSATAKEHTGDKGETVKIPKKGLLKTSRTPTPAATDPLPQNYDRESFSITVEDFDETIDTSLSASFMTSQNLFVDDTQALAINAGETLNRLVRQALYRPYNCGHTHATAAGTSSTSLPVNSINGFTHVMVDGVFMPVSANNPLAIKVGGVAVNVIGAVASETNQNSQALQHGPGVLTLDEAVDSWAQYAAVDSYFAPVIIRSGARASSDAILAGDKITPSLLRKARARLKKMGVKPFGDGCYHAHLDPVAMGDFFDNEEIKNYATGNLSAEEIQQGVIAKLMGVKFFENEYCPDVDNLDDYSDAAAIDEVGGTVTTHAGVNVRRSIILGQGALDERYVDQNQIFAQAGNNHNSKIGSFSVGSNSVQQVHNKIAHVIRPPMDRKGKLISSTWSFTGGWGSQTDSLTGDAAYYKRAVIIEHAISE